MPMLDIRAARYKKKLFATKCHNRGGGVIKTCTLRLCSAANTPPLSLLHTSNDTTQSVRMITPDENSEQIYKVD